MKTIVLAFFASASLTAWGQSYKIAGTVLDAKSKVPVEFATLWIEGSGIGTMTDSQGKFVIQHLAEGKHEVLVRCLGYSECKFIIRKSKFPQNPKRSVRFSGKRTKRSVQKRKARNTQKAETKVL